MFNKLLKYDLKYIFNSPLATLAAATLLSAVIARLVDLWEAPIADGIVLVAENFTFSLAIAAVINCMTRIGVGFKYKLFGDEAYLTHTLPVKKSTIYNSKFISALLAMVVSAIVGIASVAFAYNLAPSDLAASLETQLSVAAQIFDLPVPAYLAALAFLIALELMLVLAVSFTSMLVGHRKSDRRALRTSLTTILAYLAAQLLVVAALFTYALINRDAMSIFTGAKLEHIATVKSLFEVGILAYSLDLLILYRLDLYLLEKGVNID